MARNASVWPPLAAAIACGDNSWKEATENQLLLLAGLNGHRSGWRWCSAFVLGRIPVVIRT